MMKTTRKFLMYFTMAFAVLITSISCEGEDGMDGEDGLQGVAGVDGQDGTDGTDGEDGEDGNANVTSILFENQTITTGDTVFDIPELTQEIYDHGIVYAYVTVTGNAYWEVLPLSLSGQIILEIDKIEIGKATLRASFTQSNLKLRFVLVAGNNASSINFSDYDEVAALLID